MRRFLIIVSGLFLSYGLYAGPQDIREKAVEGRGVSTINDNFRALGQNKLDTRPGDVIPRDPAKYDLGNTSYPWDAVYAASATITSVFRLPQVDVAVSTPTEAGLMVITAAHVVHVSTSTVSTGSWMKVGAQ